MSTAAKLLSSYFYFATPPIVTHWSMVQTHQKCQQTRTMDAGWNCRILWKTAQSLYLDCITKGSIIRITYADIRCCPRRFLEVPNSWPHSDRSVDRQHQVYRCTVECQGHKSGRMNREGCTGILLTRQHNSNVPGLLTRSATRFTDTFWWLFLLFN